MNCSRHQSLGECSGNWVLLFITHSFHTGHVMKCGGWGWGVVACKMLLCTFIIWIDLGRKTVSWLAPRTLVILYHLRLLLMTLVLATVPFATCLHSSCPCHFCCWWFYFEKQAHVSWPLTPCVFWGPCFSILLFLPACCTDHHRHNSLYVRCSSSF